MSDNNDFGFAKLVPGFDFLQNLAKGTGQGLPQMPKLSSWIAPTLNVEELDKRISELKAVHFWLDQNGKALAATIQALEVQKMTLATLQGMNFSMGEMAEALRMKPAAAPARSGKADGDAAAARTSAPAADTSRHDGSRGDAAGAAKAAGAVDPLQWWGSLTRQFQEIATTAMKDVAEKAASDTARTLASGQEAMHAATGRPAPAVSSIPKTDAPAKKRSTAAKKKAAPAKSARSAPRKRAS